MPSNGSENTAPPGRLELGWDLTHGYDTIITGDADTVVRGRSTYQETIPMGVTLSEKAASEVKRIITEQSLPDTTVLRVGVQGGGCSGFSYSLNFDTSTSERDRVIDINGVKLAVDKKFDPYLDGTVVDYYDGLEKRGFVFNNPNVVKSCGCGSSCARRARCSPVRPGDGSCDSWPANQFEALRRASSSAARVGSEARACSTAWRSAASSSPSR